MKRFYFGCASGTARRILREMNEPNVFISYVTKNNKPWDGIENLAVDSGGYEVMKNEGEYQTSNEAYLSYLEEHDPDVYILRDYYCEPEILKKHGRTVRDHQEATTERHRQLLELLPSYDVSGELMIVLQGWKSRDYINHILDFEENGILDATDYVGIGTLCREGQSKRIRDIIMKISSRLPEKRLHGFGVKTGVFSKHPETVDALYSADSLAYDKRTHWDDFYDRGRGSMNLRQTVAYHYLTIKRNIITLMNDVSDTEQTRLIKEKEADG